MSNMEKKGDFFSSLILGLLQMFGQHELNKRDMQMQNQYNLNMYDRFNTPSARASELKKAGMSDSGIGQALSGYSGASINLTSAPMNPTSINDNLYSMLQNELAYNSTNQDIEVKKQEIAESMSRIDLNGVTADNLNAQTNLYITENDLKGIEKEVAEKTKDYLIKLKENDVKVQEKELEKLGYAIAEWQYEQKLNEFMKKFLDDNGYPYSDSNMVSAVVNGMVSVFERIFPSFKLPEVNLNIPWSK